MALARRSLSLFAAYGLIAVSSVACVSPYVGPVPNLATTSPAEAKRQIDVFTMEKYFFSNVVMGQRDYTPESLGFIFEAVSPNARSQFETGANWNKAAETLLASTLTYTGLQVVTGDFDKFETSRGKIGTGLVLAGLGAAVIGHVYQLRATRTFNAALRAKLEPVMKKAPGAAFAAPGASLGFETTFR